MTHVDPSTLQQTVRGLRLDAATLADNLKPPATLMVFVRHVGCIFCREMIKDVRAASEKAADFPPILFVCMADEKAAGELFDKLFPAARVICDPDKTLYDAFNLRHGDFNQLFGPRVWACAIRAVAKGNMQRLAKPVGDPWTMPGLFLIEPGGRVLWRHQFAHIGDHPDYAAIPALVTGSNAAGDLNASSI